MPPVKESVSEPNRPLMAAAPVRHMFAACLLLGAVTVAFYYPILHNHFIEFDDSAYILANPDVQQGLTWRTVRWAFTTVYAGYWHPVTWLSHAADCQMFHLNPAGHHSVNVLLHVMNALLLFLLLRKATGLTGVSYVVGALFALHPMNVESVAWAAERKNVLSMLFFLLAMHAYDRYVRSEIPRERKYLYSSVIVLFALGLMAKPQIVTLPFVLLLWDYWPLQRLWPEANAGGWPLAPTRRSLGFLVAEKLPLFVLSAIDSWIAVISQSAGHAVRTASEVSWAARLENAVVLYARYLGNAFWPVWLAPLYPRPSALPPDWELLGATALLLVISAFALRWRQHRYIGFGWFWFLGTLVPMIGIVTVGDTSMADRFGYIPLIGLFVAVVWGLNSAMERLDVGRRVLIPGAVLVLCALGCGTYRQVAYWRDDETLWRYTLSVTEGNYVAHNNLALALARKGRAGEAITEFHAAMALHRYPAAQRLTLASLELESGHAKEAEEDCRFVLSDKVDAKLSAAAWSGIGQAQLVMRQYDEAADSYRNSLGLNPDDSVALLGSGVLALRKDQLDVAVAQLARSLKGDNNDVAAVLLAQALRRGGHKAEADSVAAQVQRLSQDPHHAETAAEQFLAFAGLKPI